MTHVEQTLQIQLVLDLAQRTQLYAYRLWGYGESVAMQGFVLDLEESAAKSGATLEVPREH